MPAKLKLVPIGGWWFWCVEYDGKRIVLARAGRVGDLIHT